MQQKPIIPNRIRINYQIKLPQVRVVLEDGTSPGILPTQQALQMAKDAGLDLVEINPKVSPPICKIIDYGKYKYDEKKKASEARKNQKVTELKEITFRPATDDNDLNHKINQAKEFLQDGNKVKFTIKFRGREITHPEIGYNKMKLIVDQLEPDIATKLPPTMEGKFMFLTLSPK